MARSRLRRGRGDGDGAATVWRWGSPRQRRRGGGALRGSGDGRRRRQIRSPRFLIWPGCPRRARSTPAPLRRRWVAGDGLLRHRLVGDDGIGSAAVRVRSAAAPVRLSGAGCRGPGRGQPTCCGFVGVGDDASISLPPVPPDPVLLFFSCSSSGAHQRCGARSPLLRCSSLLRLGYFQSMLGSSLVR
ncbi:hypothetical protein OsI_28612 [Oryza sativa Indica Group]|uniref:Uncharacterized protein n=1 Tax=Oryza sativa subsp. indica TaxID=39946 RepID=A2YTH2_ORYSI|nr:hypothetical protein OsI_28612 [Oryza sativa Indica Group]